jgi:hypothetical protein
MMQALIIISGGIAPRKALVTLSSEKALSQTGIGSEGDNCESMDLALEEEGAHVTAVTSFDADFPPNNILDGCGFTRQARCSAIANSLMLHRDQTTKWLTTGSFPQEVIVQLSTTASVSRVKTWTTNAKDVVVEVCSGPTPTKWEKLFDTSE